MIPPPWINLGPTWDTASSIVGLHKSVKAACCALEYWPHCSPCGIQRSFYPGCGLRQLCRIPNKSFILKQDKSVVHFYYLPQFSSVWDPTLFLSGGIASASFSAPKINTDTYTIQGFEHLEEFVQSPTPGIKEIWAEGQAKPTLKFVIDLKLQNLALKYLTIQDLMGP